MALPVLAGTLAVLALAALLTGSRAGSVTAWAMWFWLMLAPGLAFAAIIRADSTLRTVLCAVVLSPVIAGVLAASALLAGLTPRLAAALPAVLTLAAWLAAWWSGRRRATSPAMPRREIVALAALVVVTVTLIAFLPLTREWWRVRSDAWFHAAVVAQIRDYGLPPEDPYFVGMPLQYMWIYHALVLVLAEALRLDVFRVMALLNVQALAGLCLAGWSLAGVLRTGVLHRFCATATLLFTFNAAFWVFLPVKAVRALTGDVRGVEELTRTFSLRPFTYDTARGFMQIYHNQEFFLDKFMVATAFSFALTFMTTAWLACTDWLATRRRGALAVLALSLTGMFAFHSLVGFVMLAGICGGAVLLLVFRRRVAPLAGLAALVGVALGCLLLATPYLYQLMHMKERAQIIPIDFSIAKTVGILISCAFVVVVTLRARVLFAERTPAARMLLFGAAAIAAFCLAIRLPGPNTFDKLGYFVFIPLSIPAGFAVADSIAARNGRARAAVAAAWGLLFFLPVNVLAIAGSFNTPGEPMVAAPEARMAEWVRTHTARGDVFIDADDRVFLLVTGPRRYYWGRWSYAQQWGYPRAEMARRYHVCRSLYAPGPLDAGVLQALAEIPAALYVIVRQADVERGAVVASAPGLFASVYHDGAIALYRVDAAACRAAVASAPPAPSPEVLLHASGL